MNAVTERSRILAIDPTSRGFAFVILERPGELLDWGRREPGPKNERCLDAIRAMLAEHRPDRIVIEDLRDRACRRRPRVVRLLRSIEKLAFEKRVVLTVVGRGLVRQHFEGSGATTKIAIARRITERFPQLSGYMPRPRKAWTSEDARMDLFDAAALAIIAAAAPADMRASGWRGRG
jgi:hypothetical protein